MVGNKTDRDRIIREIMAKSGFGEKKSEKAFKAVFDMMKKSLRRGEEVELPMGTLVVRKSKPRKQALQKVKRINGPVVYIIRTFNRRKRHVAMVPRKGFICE